MATISWESRRSVGIAAGLVALLVTVGGLPPTADAEPAMTEVAALARAYGVGVHAYFAGDSQRAYDDLTQAIEAGTSDPRAWYFRGLAALQLGRLDEAEADFSTAASRETSAVGDWAVSRSLERVQGRGRLALERHRVRARVAGLQQGRQAKDLRYSEIESRQSEVLRDRQPRGGSPDPLQKFGEEDISGPAGTPASSPPENVTPPPAKEAESETDPMIEPEKPAAAEPADAERERAPDASGDAVELSAVREAPLAEAVPAEAVPAEAVPAEAVPAEAVPSDIPGGDVIE